MLMPPNPTRGPSFREHITHLNVILVCFCWAQIGQPLRDFLELKCLGISHHRGMTACSGAFYFFKFSPLLKLERS